MGARSRPDRLTDLVGWHRVVDHSWTSTETILYALGVGAGQADPTTELRFTTENSVGHPAATLPTFATLLAAEPPHLGDPTLVRHAEQALTLHRPLPTAGHTRTTTTLTDVHDRGSGALVVLTSEVRTADGDKLATLRMGMFVIGAGGFGGRRSRTPKPPTPDGPPDDTVNLQIPVDQALIYRLSGDRNPLHSDPVVARRAGLPGPVLHGLCTYGYAGRVLLHTVADSDPHRLRRLDARFSAPVRPGDTLTVRMWRRSGGATFQAVDGTGAVVLDRGVAVFVPPAAP